MNNSLVILGGFHMGTLYCKSSHLMGCACESLSSGKDTYQDTGEREEDNQTQRVSREAGGSRVGSSLKEG